MAANLRFTIGEITFNLSCGPSWEFVLNRPFPIFSSNAQALVHLNVQVSPTPKQPSGPPIFEPGQAWRLYQDGKRKVIWSRTYFHDPNLVGSFEPDFLSGDIFISESVETPGKYLFPLSFPVGELLMSNLLGTGYGIMLHSCGVIDEGNGMVFAGISTAGKTTTARLWNGLAGIRVVNDDHTILRKINGHFRVYGNPWHGQGGFALAEDAPLKRIFILNHASSNQAVRLSPSRAAAALLVRAFAPLWSAEGMAFTLQFLEELCSAVPCYELGFVPDHSTVDYVRCLSTS
jgi:hypothetical protein